MNNPYISSILAITSLSFSDGLINTKNEPNHEYISTKKNNAPEYKSDKRNCDLCVNFPRKKKTTQV